MEPLHVAEHSDENPAPRPEEHLRFKRVLVPQDSAFGLLRQRMNRLAANAARTAMELTLGIHNTWSLVVLLVAHCVFIVVLSFYVHAELYPLPRGAVNRTYHILQVFKAISYLFGAVLGLLDTTALLNVMFTFISTARTKRRTKLFVLFATIALCTVLSGFIFSSPIIIPKIGSGVVFKHSCDDFWMSVLLTGHRFGHTDEPNYAEFAMTSAPRETLFRFTSSADGSDFGVSFVAPNGSGVRPTLRQVTYDFEHNTFSGSCYDETSSNSSSSAQCASGTVDPRGYLTFDVSTPDARSIVRSEYVEWTLEDVPSAIMHSVDILTGALETRVLQTSLGACPRLKVCVDYSVTGGMLRADILVAIGWLLQQQAVYSVKCTHPSD